MADPVLGPDQAGFLAGPVTILLASADRAGVPTVAVGLGVRLSEDRRTVTVLVLDTTSGGLLADLRAGGAVAVVFTHSRSARAVQLKAPAARVRPAPLGIDRELDAYAAALTRELAANGAPSTFGHAFLARAPGTVVAVELEPTELYDQTPGPAAGAALGRQP